MIFTIIDPKGIISKFESSNFLKYSISYNNFIDEIKIISNALRFFVELSKLSSFQDEEIDVILKNVSKDFLT
jgi:hypothetical protein